MKTSERRLRQVAAANARYRQRIRERAHALIGTSCFACGGGPVDMAHVAPTEVSGRGRGMDRRYRDVLKHPLAYTALCKACHIKADNP